MSLPALLKIISGFDIPKTVEEIFTVSSDLEYYKDHPATFDQDYGARATITTNAGSRGSRFDVRVGRSRLYFNVESDPVCCGVGYIYGFATQNFPDEQIKIIMDYCLRYTSEQLGYGGGLKNRRFLINMVETRRNATRDPSATVEPVEAPHMIYSQLYEYFIKNATKVSTMLMPNANSGNIIHHMELVFPPL